MTNYYEILGLSYGAGIGEIKAAFRVLAKQYHPDKNPDGIEHFSKILKAYETLSDPVLKTSYDYKLNYHQAQTQQQHKSTTGTKNWKFDERELKRRQYYNDHIKKYARETSEFMAENETKKNYNEFRYILFATPVAVILFLLVMNLTTPDKIEVLNKLPPDSAGEKIAEIEEPDPGLLKTGDTLYTSIFGASRRDEQSDKVLLIKNVSDLEVIMCLFTKKTFVRCIYIRANDSAQVTQLPAEEKLYVKYSSGSNFDPSKELNGIDEKGSFSVNQAFYKRNKAFSPGILNALTLPQEANGDFKKIDETEFFKKMKKTL